MKTQECPVENVKLSLRFIDPADAAKLLQTNPEHQRNVSRSNLTKIEHSLNNGEFRVTGESLIVDENGRLMDGQHRLQACVNTGIGFWTVFVSGIPA